MRAPPGLGHALLALALQAIIAAPLAFIMRDGPMAFAIGAYFAIGFYIGRERRQAEEEFGSNRIPPWVWLPRSLRDAGWPALAVVVACIAVFFITR